MVTAREGVWPASLFNETSLYPVLPSSTWISSITTITARIAAKGHICCGKSQILVQDNAISVRDSLYSTKCPARTTR
jgi:hypothetical protein